MLERLNRERAAAGVPHLRKDERLLDEAEATAARLARNGTLKVDIEAFEIRLRQARYPLRKLGTVTGAANAPPGQVIRRYLSDDGTRALLLSPEYSEIGLGLAPRRSADGKVWVIALAEPYAQARNGWKDDILDGVNAFRARHGLDPLVEHEALSEIAQSHSEDMAARDFFAHDTPDGISVADRARGAGYKYRAVGENIAAGMRRPSRAVEGWINSPPHREAMLDPEYREAGIGYAYDPFDDGAVRSVHYWTLTLGQR